MTFEEFERLDFGADYLQLLEAQLIRLPTAQKNHAMICKRLFRRLDDEVEGFRQRQPSLDLGAVYVEMGYLLTSSPRSWLQPDVSLTWPGQTGDKYFDGVPQLVFEIVSESETAASIDGKVKACLAKGAAEVWMFYPEGRAWVYTPSCARLETKAITSPHLPGVSIPFADFL